jgi:hypothetical protein
VPRYREGGCLGLLYTVGIGVPLTFAGLAATGALLFDPPPQASERLAAFGVAVFCLISGPAFIALALPDEWEAPARLWRWCGWLLIIAPLPIAYGLLSDPEGWAEDTRQIGSAFGSIVLGLALVAAAAGVGWLWLRSARSAWLRRRAAPARRR